MQYHRVIIYVNRLYHVGIWFTTKMNWFSSHDIELLAIHDLNDVDVDLYYIFLCFYCVLTKELENLKRAPSYVPPMGCRVVASYMYLFTRSWKVVARYLFSSAHRWPNNHNLNHWLFKPVTDNMGIASVGSSWELHDL